MEPNDTPDSSPEAFVEADWRSLDRYLAGDATPDDIRWVDRWVAIDATHAAFLNVLRDPSLRGVTRRNRDVGRAWSEVARRLTSARSEAVPYDGVQNPTRSSVRIGQRGGSALPRWIAGSVAGLVVALLIGVRTYRFDMKAGAENETWAKSYATRVGEQASLTLSDGSRVRLAPKTILRVPADFGGTSRTVSLVGEAYFEIPHAAGAPFVVRTGRVTTRVLGTTFDVQRYPEDGVLRIAVISGKVSVAGESAEHRLVTLSSGMIGETDDSSVVTMNIEDGNAEQYSAWASGSLIFRDAPMPIVLAALTRWYGLEFHLSDSTLVHHRITIGLSTESSQVALSTLKSVLGVDLTQDGNLVTLRSGANVPKVVPRRLDPRALPSTSHRELGR